MAYERFFRSGVLDIPPLPSSSYFATEPLHPNAHAEDLPEVSRDDTLDREPAVTDDSDDFDVPITDLTCRAGSRSPLRRVENSSANERYGHSQPLSHSLALEGNIYKTAVHSHDKPRRVFSDSSNAQIMVSTRGFISKVKLSPSQHQHVLFIPPAATHEYVDDACVLQIRNNAVMVLAHGREDQQLSFLSLDDAQGLRSLDRPWNPVKKGGTSALTTMMQPLMFASGGYDHAVHIWAFKEDLSNASPVLLSIKHTSAVHSLLPIRDTSHKLISAGADCNVRLWDLSAERVLNTLKPSNTPYHAHATESPFCTLLEVSHRELQYEIHDHRMVPEHPVQRFGYDAPEPHGRFPKGDFWSHFFASGTRNGEVRLWDLRNLGGQPASVSCFGTDHVVQVLASASRIVACSRRGELARIKIAQA
ncbi:hypothetical protein BV22DRAFT_1021517 [Leucogyrophana mollusca]|uniref:Uncharacterized protein n=1 Tax=Leucogyrophana mollusca TaxID=85980 RepID=A0ACB8B3Z1_9AGAM|nr:hypothetical protein BV22DRAFT_1021517 [Leucogyrophana mollusca]